MFKILGAKNRRKNLHKHPSPPFKIRGGPGSFSIAVPSPPYTQSSLIRNGPIRITSEILGFFKKSLVKL